MEERGLVLVYLLYGIFGYVEHDKLSWRPWSHCGVCNLLCVMFSLEIISDFKIWAISHKTFLSGLSIQKIQTLTKENIK